MREVGAFEAKNRFGQLLDWVEDGGDVIITRHGKEVARMIPARHSVSREEAQAAIQRMRARAVERKPGKFDWPRWKSYRDEGRP
jgi:prevent-host-death family protein